MVELRAEVDACDARISSSGQQVGYWQSRHRDALLRNAALEQKIEQLEGEKRQLQADLFGRRSETKPLVDRSQSPGRSPGRHSQQPKRKRGQQPENTSGADDSDRSVSSIRDSPSNVCRGNRYVSAVIPKIPSNRDRRAASASMGRRYEGAPGRETHLTPCRQLIPRYGFLWGHGDGAVEDDPGERVRLLG